MALVSVDACAALSHLLPCITNGSTRRRNAARELDNKILSSSAKLERTSLFRAGYEFCRRTPYYILDSSFCILQRPFFEYIRAYTFNVAGCIPLQMGLAALSTGLSYILSVLFSCH